MMFVNSLKLFATNWVKCLKFLLYYIVIWGICTVLLLPVIFEFKDIVSSVIENFDFAGSCVGVFGGMAIGENMYNIMWTAFILLIKIFDANIGLAIYGLIVILLVLPFLINVGKYTLYDMLYSYMTSKNKIGFFSALIKGLRKSLLFALCKTFYNLFFLAITFACVYAVGLVRDAMFITYFLPIIEFLILVLFFSLNQMDVLGWGPALIVFDKGVFYSYKKGCKAVKRHFWTIFGTTILYFLLFWLFVIVFGVYVMLALVPIMTALLCVYNMTIFFTSQGMRFYINEKRIMTPKKLEEVDNINKTVSIL